ncbi:DUF4328 domain-containing protein [Kitasatospora sp. McL0602]|uniref:DUF4328 domain-containing protein n=1 Tax=Kitasatospora sp. McL0602 TaxID=3439530 RepID=UPI003F899AA0
MSSGFDGAAPRALAYSGLVADPRPLAWAAQGLIAAQTVAQLVLAAKGGTRSAFFVQSTPLSVLLFLATIVVFVCWFRRCRRNAEHFAPGTHRHSAGFAVGGWFIPVVWLWLPRRVALDIWRAGSPVGGVWLINLWWAAWLAKNLGGAIATRFEAHPNGYASYDVVVGVVAAVLAILVVRQITAGQDAKVRSDLAGLSFAPTVAG